MSVSRASSTVAHHDDGSETNTLKGDSIASGAAHSSGSKEEIKLEDGLGTTDTEELVCRPASSDDEFPDGGSRAWLVVLGGMFNTFVTFGTANAWGVFQSYYQEDVLRSSSPSSIAWIGSLQYALVFAPGLITGRLFDIGYFHVISIPATIFVVGATFLVAQCTQYWQFLLCQGVAVGLGCGVVFSPTAAVIAHWFKKRRGLALGIVTMGSSFGGTLLPITIRQLIPLVGFQWTMRIVSFILLLVLGASNLLMKRRLPPKNVSGGLINLADFKNAAYSVYCVSGLFVFLGLYTLLTYVSVSANRIGIPSDIASYLVAMANATSLLGRYLGGMSCDRIGPMNVMMPLTAAAGILTYAWPYAESRTALMAVTLLYGIFVGAYVSLVSNPIMEMGDTRDVGRRIGMFFSIMAIGAVAGPPISGAISAETNSFVAVGFYAGTCVLVGVTLMGVSRYFVLGRFVGKA